MTNWKLCFALLLPLTVCENKAVRHCLDDLTSMGGWKLRFVVLLTITFHIDSKATSQQLVKTIGSKPDVTPLCTNDTLNVIVFIVCKISSERISGEECRLKYRHGGGFTHECDCRFTLMTDNHTVFLHLSRLTPEDSGNYTCRCSRLDGTYVVHLNITVEEDEDVSSSTRTLSPWVGVSAAVIIAALIVGFTYRIKRNGDCSMAATSGLSVCEAPGSLDPDDPDDPYTSLQHPESELYQTISPSTSQRVTVHCNNQEVDGGESDPSCTVYDNLQD
ncbi:uncharacterized protein LOC143316171 [Chaetodon auriga]|uniref:uncharacterized protein LOC143316171 n=1 Tax=Chaetodon auriga TaxID=39042 RepID=UPI004032FA74